MHDWVIYHHLQFQSYHVFRHSNEHELASGEFQ